MITSRKHKPSKSKSSDSQSADLFAQHSITVKPPAPQSALVPSPSHVQLPSTANNPAQLSLFASQIPIMQALIDSAGVAESLSVTSEGLQGPGVSRLDEASRVCVTRAILERAQGETWIELAARGRPFILVCAFVNKDKALKKLFEAGEEAFRNTLAMKLEARLARRATKPLKKYVIGRVGKDQDGVLTHPDTGELLEVEPDNGKLLEFALEKVHPAYKKATQEASSGGSAKQITYNINVGNLLVAPGAQAPVPKSIEADFTDNLGENRAEKSPFV